MALFQHCSWVILHAFLLSADFFKIKFFEKFFHEYNQRVKQFGFRSGPTFCQALSKSKLFAKVVSRQELKLGSAWQNDFDAKCATLNK